jgi:hypothetical protein
MKYFDKLNKWLILVILVISAGMISCDEGKIFEEELYKKNFALISGDDNIFTVIHDLDSTEFTGYVAASVGGTNPTETAIDVLLKQDLNLFDNYNKTHYDMDYTKFANLLPTDKYDIDNYGFTIPVGGRSGRVKIVVRPEGLSPDSVYFVPLKVDKFSAYEVNPDKNDVLYSVAIENKYSLYPYSTLYSQRAIRTGVNSIGTKALHPISRNKVRIMAGIESFEKDTAIINRYGIVLEIDDNNKVHISAFKNPENSSAKVIVTQIDDDSEFPNIFKIDNDGFKDWKTFLLRYNYKLGAVTYEMQEELRLELKEDERYKFLIN